MLMLPSGRPKAVYKSKLSIFCKRFLPVSVDTKTHVMLYVLLYVLLCTTLNIRVKSLK